MRRIRQALGPRAGVARSVVSDIERKDVRDQDQDHEGRRQDRVAREGEPDRQEQYDLDLLDQHVERVGQEPLECDALLGDSGDDAGEAGSVRTNACRPIATSVAEDMAIPICACRSAGASFTPSTTMIRRFIRAVPPGLWYAVIRPSFPSTGPSCLYSTLDPRRRRIHAVARHSADQWVCMNVSPLAMAR
jgi:hypothetical protein